MATLQEYYNTNDDGAQSLYGNNWRAQTFITTSAYSIDFVKLKLYKIGSPGTITVSIRATDVNGRPTGGDLDGVTGTIADSELTTDSGGDWETIALSGSIALSDATKYAIVVRAPSGSSGNIVYWRSDNSSPTYADGNVCGSSNGGGSWFDIFAADAMFECWGISAGVIEELSGSISIQSSISGQLDIDKSFAADVICVLSTSPILTKERSLKGDVSILLDVISSITITTPKKIEKIVQLSSYLLLEIDENSELNGRLIEKSCILNEINLDSKLHI